MLSPMWQRGYSHELTMVQVTEIILEGGTHRVRRGALGVIGKNQERA